VRRDGPGHRGRGDHRDRGRGGVRRPGRRRPARRDPHGLGVRPPGHGGRLPRARRSRDPPRGARHVRAPRPRHRGRLRQERADARDPRAHLRGWAGRRAARRGRRPHGAAGDRGAADLLEVDRGRARRPPVDRADAPGRARGLRRRGLGEERRGARGAHHQRV
ncbi:MAG: N5-carboxyaminoimidazole ribonucleotide mutase, partial [uncultured Solirubrobacteraceae bacterium]